MNPLFRNVLVAASTLACASAQAQLIDDVGFRREGADAVLQVRFVTAVQFRSASVAASGDSAQVFFDLVGTTDLPTLTPSERRIAGAGPMPSIVVRDESAGRENLNRRLIVRLGTAVPLRIRAGEGNRTIEIVLVGRGASIPKPFTQAEQTPPPSARFFVNLLQSDDPAKQLEAAVPSALQAYDVFTGRREVDGRTVYEVNLGYFATLIEAESARRTLLARFPNAAVVALAPAAVRAVPSQPVAPEPVPVAVVPAVPVAPAVPLVAPAAPTVAAADTPPPLPAAAQAQEAALLAAARAAEAQGDLPGAIDKLNLLLNLPPGPATREAQELVGDLRLKSGDAVRARAEYELFLRLYPTGADSDRVRQAMARLPAPAPATPVARARPKVEPTSVLSGSVSAFYYGGASKVRTQEFQDSPISGLPELVGDNTLSGSDQKQIVGNVDLNWRYRDTDTDMRFVLRDAYSRDQLNPAKSRNRLSALYFEHRSLAAGTSVKLGRQSASGGGVLGRFDGVQAGYGFAPKWRVNAVVGVPDDKLLDSKRHFYGAWVDGEALTPEVSGSVYAIRQMIDGEVDRSAVGTEVRYFKSGISVSGNFDYDAVIKGINIASVQGTWQAEDQSVVNFLYDRRSTPMLMLGNTLFFQDPALPLVQSLKALIDAGASLDTLRSRVKATTSYTTQGLFGVTRPLAKNWQIGGDVRLTNVGELLPVPVILPSGQGRSDNLSLGGQLIGSNLYSERDTHVFSVSLLRGKNFSLITPDVVDTYTGALLTYNNSSQLNDALLLEPSIKFYHQTDSRGVRSDRWSPGLRFTYRAAKQLSLESEVSAEFSKTTSAARTENSNRTFYYLGGRYDY